MLTFRKGSLYSDKSNWLIKTCVPQLPEKQVSLFSIFRSTLYKNYLNIVIKFKVIKFIQFTVEIKSKGEYLMASIKGWYFQRIMDESEYARGTVLLL